MFVVAHPAEVWGDVAGDTLGPSSANGGAALVLGKPAESRAVTVFTPKPSLLSFDLEPMTDIGHDSRERRVGDLDLACVGLYMYLPKRRDRTSARLLSRVAIGRRRDFG